MSKEKSKIAKQLFDVKKRISKVISEREEVPRTLFWSLFHSQVETIKESKKKNLEKREQWLSGELEIRSNEE